jgi:DNA primase
MNELRDRLTLSDIIGRRVKLARAGREFKGCCPFHNEKTPSFYVNDDKQFYHCFGCGVHGDVINFVMQHDNQSFIDAVEMLSAEAGMEMPKQKPADRQKAKKEKDLYQLMDEATKFCQTELGTPSCHDARQYMEERGITQELIDIYRIGFAPADRTVLHKHLKTLGYSEKDMMDVGLIRKSDKDGSYYAFFRDRIVFPVIDRRGRVLAFGGRVLPDHLRPPSRSDYTPAKYINSSDSKIFHKGRILFGEPQARQAALDGERVIVVEGYMDVIACFQGGFKGAVAPMGTALTDDQIVGLWKMCPDDFKAPVLCFDGDNAGRRAASRAAENVLPLLKPNHTVQIAFLPEGEDPDSLLKKSGAAAFEDVMARSMPLSEFLWFDLTHGKVFDTPEERAGLSKSLDDRAAVIADRSVQHHYQSVFKDKVYKEFRSNKGYSKQSYGGKYGGGSRGNRGHVAVPQVKVRKPLFSNAYLSWQILYATLLNHPYIFDQVEETFGALDVSDKRLNDLRQEIILILHEDSALDSEHLRKHLHAKGYDRELDNILSDAVYVHAAFARPNADSSNILSGWQETLDFLHKKAVKTSGGVKRL